MSCFSYYCRNKLYGSLLGMDTFPKPQTFIGFSNSIPVDPPGTVIEPTAEDYNRVLYTHWKISNNRDVSNNTTITLYSRSDWGTLRYFTIWDAQVGGNLLGYGELPAPVAVPTGKVLSFSKGKLALRVNSGTITDYLSNRFLEHLFGVVSLSSIHSYVGLSYVNPGDAGNPVTPVDRDYHDVLFLGWEITAISELVNTLAIIFLPRHDWGTLPYIFIRDGENRTLFYSAFINPIVANLYSPVLIDPYYLTIVFD